MPAPVKGGERPHARRRRPGSGVWFDRVMSGDDLLSEARAELEAGRVRRAKDLLESQVARERDAEALKLLGEVRHRLGDLSGAGAAWFATSAKGPAVDESIAAWRKDHNDDFGAMWRSIPRSARQEPLTPKLTALKAKADAMAAARKTAEAAPAASAAAGSVAKGDRAAVRPERETPSVATKAETGRARHSPSEPHVRTASDPEAPAEESGGFDAAKVIAWVLAALFVVCAVVGLVTILQWIVPGT